MFISETVINKRSSYILRLPKYIRHHELLEHCRDQNKVKRGVTTRKKYSEEYSQDPSFGLKSGYLI
jgi:hypothetical protein